VAREPWSSELVVRSINPHGAGSASPVDASHTANRGPRCSRRVGAFSATPWNVSPETARSVFELRVPLGGEAALRMRASSDPGAYWWLKGGGIASAADG